MTNQIHDHAQEAVAEGLEDPGADYAHGGEDKAEGDDPQGHDADGEELRRGIEKAHELRRKDLEDDKAHAHDHQGHFVGQLHDFVDPLSMPGAVVVGDDGDKAVVHAEDGHKDEALHFKVDPEGHHGDGAECGENGVDHKDGQGIYGNHNGRRDAHGQNAFNDAAVDMEVILKEVDFLVPLEIQIEPEEKGDDLARYRSHRRPGDAQFREEGPTENKEGVEDNVQHRAEELGVHAVDGEARGLQKPLHADLAAKAHAEHKADV